MKSYLSEIFIPTTKDEISRKERELNLKLSAEENGSENYPNQQMETPDAIEGQIQYDLLDLANKLESEFDKEINEKEVRLQKLKQDYHQDWEKIRLKTELWESEIQQKIEDYRQKKAKLEEDLSRTKNILNDFKKSHNITREAYYSDNVFLSFSLIVFAIAMEMLLNSVLFFAEKSEQGLVGGFLIALMLSLGNVAVPALVTFFGVRQLLSNIKFWRFIGLLSCLFLILIVPMNFLISHYRELEFTENVMLDLTSKIEENYLFTSLDSWGLFFVGIVFAAFGIYKGLNIYDPIPGYTRVHKNYQEALKNKEEYENLIKTSVLEEKKKVAKEVGRYDRNIRLRREEFVSVKQSQSHLIKLLLSKLGLVNKLNSNLIEKYRMYNISFRTDKTTIPSFFYEAPAILRPIPKEETIRNKYFEHELEIEISDFEEKLNSYQKKIEESYQNFIRSLDMK
jgi:hypothetical protein